MQSDSSHYTSPPVSGLPGLVHGVSGAQGQWSMEQMVEMIDGYHKRKLDEKFELAFADRSKAPRITPKTFEPRIPAA